MARLSCSAFPHYTDTVLGEPPLGESGVYPISGGTPPLRSRQSRCKSAISVRIVLLEFTDAVWTELYVTLISGGFLEQPTECDSEFIELQ